MYYEVYFFYLSLGESTLDWIQNAEFKDNCVAIVRPIIADGTVRDVKFLMHDRVSKLALVSLEEVSARVIGRTVTDEFLKKKKKRINSSSD